MEDIKASNIKRWSMPLGEKPNLKRIMTNDQQQINVYCRFRPIEEPGLVSSYYKVENDKRTIDISAPEEVLQRLGGIKRYYFSYVFNEKDGNAGKTYTMVGNSKHPGVIKNCFKFLFDIRQKFLSGELQMQSSEPQTPKLITPARSQLSQEPPLQSKSKPIPSSQNGEIPFHEWFLFKEQFDGLIMKVENKKIVFEEILTRDCQTLDDGLEALNKCLANRSIVETMLNSKSSRSHCVFKILVVFCFENEKECTQVERYINIVDLAGSERTKRTENLGNKLKEANKINQSLSCLGRCLSALRENKIPPYRETKLTRYLSEFFIDENFITESCRFVIILL